MKEFENIDAVKTGKFIKELRRSHNMKQDELGEKLFISRKSVSKWETGRACPSIDMLKRLSNVFNVTVYDLMAGEFIGEPKKEDSEHKFVNVKNFKRIGIFSVVTILILLFGLYSLYKHEALTFMINYEDENFYINAGLLVLEEGNSYIGFGKVETYIESVNVEDLKCILYVENDDVSKELLTVNFDKTNKLSDEVREEIINNIVENEIKSLYIKIFYFNESEEEVSFKINLKVVRHSKTFVSNARKMDENRDKHSLVETHSNFSEENDEELSNSIDVSFLFEMDKRYLENYINGKVINYNGMNYNAKYDNIEDILTFQFETNIIQIFLESKRILTFGDVNTHFIVDDDNVVRKFELDSYFNLLVNIVHYLGEVDDCS